MYNLVTIFYNILVNCPVQGLEEDTGNGTRTVTATERLSECETADAKGFIKIKHANPNDITDTGYFTLPTEKKPKQIDFPNLKRGQPILKERIIMSMEATGLCFCWELHEVPRYGGKQQLIYPGDVVAPETAPGAIKRVLCPDDDY